MKEEENITNAEINIIFYIPNIRLAKAPCYKNNNVEKDSDTVPSSFPCLFCLFIKERKREEGSGNSIFLVVFPNYQWSKSLILSHFPCFPLPSIL
jgi:hypothetical protein